MSEYPKQMFHPNNFRTMTVYNADQETEALKSFDTWRNDHMTANLASVNKQPVKPAAKAEK